MVIQNTQSFTFSQQTVESPLLSAFTALLYIAPWKVFQ